MSLAHDGVAVTNADQFDRNLPSAQGFIDELDEHARTLRDVENPPAVSPLELRRRANPRDAETATLRCDTCPS